MKNDTQASPAGRLRTRASSPASTGPAGAHFKGQVGAHYLLSMLIGSEPRGLPGVTIDLIAFQRGAEGHPLDDVIVHAHDEQGAPAVLEIQVKRGASFAPADPVFRDVVSQVAAASRHEESLTTRHELAVAVARSSHRIDGAYQEVLTWARRLGSAQTFMDRIHRPGSANEQMRTFVDTFKKNLRMAGASDGEEVVWRLLSRLQILLFDFTDSGSLAEALDEERAARALHDDEANRAGDFRRRLVELTIETAASAGDLTRERLIERLHEGAFRLAGQRQYRIARRAFAEASRHALDDIGDRVGGVTLTRVERTTAVRAALDQGRYVEIRGDGGVGKSALLKQVAEQRSTEAAIVVLSPGRTTPGGWSAMRSVLGFDDTARALLVDMAGTGSATIFLDGLDFFSPEERLTVRDLVREAAGIPGFAIIATARNDFGADDDPNWLPEDAIEILGRADAIVVGELSVAEVDELRSAAPELGPLLGESHPARAVARNLFRLARLAQQPGGQSPRTEIDMAEQWWRSADGGQDGRRDRSRLLQDLADRALADGGPVDARDHPSHAVDALVQSHTLRDLGGDHVAFRHDVYRDWAIANVLCIRPETRECLALHRPAPASLARGVELAARAALERSTDDSRWRALLAEVSRNGTHGSWRRAVLLAPVRSEIGIDLLQRVCGTLLADRGSLLRELVRTVIAVEAVAARAFVAPGVDPATIPEHLHVPGAPSWWRLILWLLGVGERLPSAAIPEVEDLYAGWCVIGEDQITPKLVSWLFRWLTEIENRTLGGALSGEHEGLLETNLRSEFLSFCHHAPPLAAAYLQSLKRRRQGDRLVGAVLKSPGSLSRAAPEELAQLTISMLLPDPTQDGSDPSVRRSAFDHAHLFLPPSPESGPFRGLLDHAPATGLNLIRRIVDHAVSFERRGHSAGSDGIVIPGTDGDRTFPYPQSYVWARPFRGPTVVAAALMALEQWGQRRLEDGDSVDAVLADILGSSNAPAAYLLVAVDLLLTHWPLSREAAIPFAAGPEILCLDLDLALTERFGDGIPARYADARTVRYGSLYDLLGQYAVSPPFEHRERLAELLRVAMKRLGPYGERSDRGDPDFMAAHAINLLDPRNWKSIVQPDGTSVKQYVVPDVEERHLARLSEHLHGQLSAAELQMAITSAVDGATRSSPELAATAARWAAPQTATAENHRTIVAAAMLVMRDGDDDLRDEHAAWARTVFARTVPTPLSPFEAATSLCFNPVAIAFTGWAFMLKRNNTREDRRSILDLTARGGCAAVPGFRAVAATLGAVDRRLPRSVLRTALAACIRTRDRGTRQAATHRHTENEEDRGRVGAAIEAELAWMDGAGSEPAWPQFPPYRLLVPRVCFSFEPDYERSKYSLPERPPQEYADVQTAGRWLDAAGRLFEVSAHPWLHSMTLAYAEWTAAANGAGLDDNRGFDQAVSEWNAAYFKVAAHCLPGLEPPEMDAFALDLITSLPDRTFFGVVEVLLPNVDRLYFGAHGLLPAQAVHVRSVLADRVCKSQGWCRWDVASLSVENNLGRAVAALFLADGYSHPPRCLLRPESIDRVAPLLPTLQPLAGRSTCFHLALSLLEVEPRAAHLEFIVAATEAWLETHPDSGEFWGDYGAGRRVCALIAAIRQQHPPTLRPGCPLRDRADHLLAALVSAGVPEAAQLEKTLSAE